MIKKQFSILIFAFIILISIFSINAAAFSAEHANFSLVYNGFKIPLNTFSIFVMPREKIKIYIAEKNRNKKYVIELNGKQFESNKSFKWQAPSKSGYYPVIIKEKNTSQPGSEIKLNVFVLHPARKMKGQYFDGFRIGSYLEIPADKKAHYSNPDGFLKIEESFLDLNLSPHFKMEQFITKQCSELPQYIVLKESLLLKLEYFLEEVNKAGYQAETFGILSAYRSPYFNKKLGNNTNFSRHLFGDAADIYIDYNHDNWMDDLNKDNCFDKRDADILYNLAVQFDHKSKFSILQGGVSSYEGNGVRGSFIHIDARGFHVSW